MNTTTKSDGLRLMVLDKTDVRKTWGVDINGDGEDDLKLAIELGLSHSWFAGGKLYRVINQIDDYGGFANWIDALNWLLSYKPGEPIAEIQFWMHGSPGRVWMNKKPLTYSTPEGDTAEGVLLRRLANRLTPDALLWFRTCATFAGTAGHRFAKSWANAMNCRIAAHTHIIGWSQSGLHSIKPGQEPDWSSKEGIELGTPDLPKKIRWSGMGMPHTINCLQSSFPKTW